MLKNPFDDQTRNTRLLSFAILAIGVFCISWALLNITQQNTFLKAAPESPTLEAQASLSIMMPPTGAVSKTNSTQKNVSRAISINTLHPVAISEGDVIGELLIPTLYLRLPIYEGSSVETLKKGVGHFSQSVMPGLNDNCILSGHRDTVFSKLGKLVVDDILIVTTDDGTFTYKVSKMRIVEKDDRTVIVPTDHGVMTLTTCYPFHFIGSAPQRYIVSADLVIEK